MEGEKGESETKRRKERTARGQFIRQTNGLLISAPPTASLPKCTQTLCSEGEERGRGVLKS